MKPSTSTFLQATRTEGYRETGTVRRGRRHPAAVGAVLVLLAAAGWLPAVPADGGYEGNVAPTVATPAWQPGSPFSDKMSSAIRHLAVKDGMLVKPTGTPAYTGMYLDTPPWAGTSYTVEMRFRITRVDATKKYTPILSLLPSKKGSAYHWLTVGQGYDRNWKQGYFRANLCLDNEWDDMIRDPAVTGGGWFIARLVVEDNIGSLRARTYLNGTLVQEVITSEKSRRPECLYLRTGGEQTSSELDYIRWKGSGVPISTPLEPALSDEDRARQAETELMKKMEALFE